MKAYLINYTANGKSKVSVSIAPNRSIAQDQITKIEGANIITIHRCEEMLLGTVIPVIYH